LPCLPSDRLCFQDPIAAASFSYRPISTSGYSCIPVTKWHNIKASCFSPALHPGTDSGHLTGAAVRKQSLGGRASTNGCMSASPLGGFSVICPCAPPTAPCAVPPAPVHCSASLPCAALPPCPLVSSSASFQTVSLLPASTLGVETGCSSKDCSESMKVSESLSESVSVRCINYGGGLGMATSV
jgi:hypothetical protein